MSLSIELTALLTFVAFAAGFISSIAGSGGLLTLPLLLWAGLPPLQALATNKVQSALGTLSSTWNFFRKGHLSLRELMPSIVFALLGSAVGTITVQHVGNDVLIRLIPIMLIAMALYFIFSPRMADHASTARISHLRFAMIVALPMGFYGGFFGPGMGSIFPFLFVWLCGYSLPSATAQTKVMVLTINATSAVLFIVAGHVLWDLAALMSVAQVIGARLGSNAVMSRGTRFVQPVIIVVTLAMAIKLLVWP
ncbi:MAG: hypothetical protein DRR06_11330 [Gammaproteobacteria bacterium]|nr:MAG: hypothetical protein DRR06_11330 [Gammaproteobacteria bacterium]